MQMETPTQEIGSKTSPKERESTFTQMALCTKVSGKTTSSTGKVRRPGLTVATMTVTTIKVRNLVKVSMSGVMAPNLMEYGRTTR